MYNKICAVCSRAFMTDSSFSAMCSEKCRVESRQKKLQEKEIARLTQKEHRTVGENLRLARLMAGFSIKELCEASRGRLNTPSICGYESDKKRPSSKTVKVMESVLRVHLEHFIGRVGSISMMEERRRLEAKESSNSLNMGEAIKLERMRLGLTQRELARLAGVASGTVQHLESRKVKWSSEVVVRSIGEVLGNEDRLLSLRSRHLRTTNNKEAKRRYGKYVLGKEAKTIPEWADDPRCVVGRNALLLRLKKGWSLEDAISTPPWGKPFGKSSETTQKVCA